MNIKDSQGREVEITHVWSSSDDIQFDARYVDSDSDTDEEVPDSEMNWIADHYAAELYDEWFEGQIGRADALLDAWKHGDFS